MADIADLTINQNTIKNNVNNYISPKKMVQPDLFNCLKLVTGF